MNLYIKRYDDYRTGIDITVIEEENLKYEYLSDSYESESNSESDSESDDLDLNELCTGDLDLKLMTDEKFNDKLNMDENILDIITLNNAFNDTYAVYLIYGEGNHEPENTNVIHIINQSNKDDAVNMMKHLYSDINDHQPFFRTSDDYKPEGYYPEALPKFFINSNPLINELIKTISEDLPDYCVSVIINNEKLIDYLQISNH